MFSFAENLKALRHKKGLTQEVLAIKLNVTRQTISKWEKGISVPDAEMLVLLAESLEVSISQLLGQQVPETVDQNEIAGYLAQIVEQLAIKNRRTKRIVKVVAGIIAVIVVLYILLVAIGSWTISNVTASPKVNDSEGSVIANEPYNGLAD